MKNKLPSVTGSYDQYILDEIRNVHWIEKSRLFASSIRQHLIDNSISKADFALKLEISIEELDKILSGKEDLKLSTIAHIEQTIGMRKTAFGLQYTDPVWYKKHIEEDTGDDILDE